MYDDADTEAETDNALEVAPLLAIWKTESVRTCSTRAILKHVMP